MNGIQTWLITLWHKLRASYWFIPTLMTVAAFILGFVSTSVDRQLKMEKPDRWSYIYTGGADGARALFSTVSGSMITVAGVVFSVTVLILALAAQQFGARLLHNFMRDRGNQIVLGTFVSTYVFCLVALAQVRGLDERSFVPHVTVTVAVVMALASLGVLIYYIHHVASSISPATIIQTVGVELDYAMKHLYPKEIGEGGTEKPIDEALASDEQQWPPPFSITATKGGYVQYLDGDGLMEICRDNRWIIRTLKRPGSLVLKDDEIAQLYTAEEPTHQEIAKVRSAFVIGHERTSMQDIIFPINQLVQLAQRALSPGINDPQTAMLAIDRLTISLAMLAKREIPSGKRLDEEGRLRLVTRPHTFEEAVQAAIDPIRHYAGNSLLVSLRLMLTLEELAKRIRTPEHLSTLRRQIEQFDQCLCHNNDLCKPDRDALNRRLSEIVSEVDRAGIRIFHGK